MSNIHTLADLDKGPGNAQAMPNPWAGGGAVGGGGNTTNSATGGITTEDVALVDNSPEATKKIVRVEIFSNFKKKLGEDTKDFSSCPFWSYNLPPSVPPTPYQLIFQYFCCPFFVGNPCTKTRKRDYLAHLYNSMFILFLIDFVYFIVECGFGLQPFDLFSSFYDWGFQANNAVILRKLGGKYAYDIKQGHVWRLFTPIFMHGGIFHFLMNMGVQISFGMGYERYWKFYRMIPIYFISGIFGNIFSCVVNQNSVSVGASGAILGFLFALIPYVICAWTRLPNYSKLNFIIQMGMVLFMAVIMSFSKNVDWSAHLGGAIMGVLIGFVAHATFLKNKYVMLTIMVVAGLLALVLYITFFLVFYLAINPTSM